MGLSFTAPTQAALEARAGGMLYDDVNNITWAADANLFKTQVAANPDLVSQIIAANGGVIYDTPNVFDDQNFGGSHNLVESDFNSNNGSLTWWGAQAWVNNLDISGVTGWTLPSTPTPEDYANDGYNITTSQLGDLFYTQLGGVANVLISTTHNANYNLFANIQDNAYWSIESPLSPEAAWDLWYSDGHQNLNWKPQHFYALAVHAGDVAPVPLPGAVWLFLSGLIGFMGLKRRGHIG